jgi:DNA-binding response OmpR family regulator
MPAEGSKPKVLVVEDDAMVRGLLTRHLRREGYEVSEAPDAETVINNLDTTDYDVVLADVHLPGQSGVEMVRQMKSTEVEPAVVFVTGDSDEKLARTALEEGAAGYLMKPFEFFELDAVLRSALANAVTRVTGRAPVREADVSATGRAVARPVDQARAMQVFRKAVQHPEMVVLREGRNKPRKLPVGLRAVLVVAASIALSWFAGQALLSRDNTPREPVALSPLVTPQPSTVVVPVVIDRSPAPSSAIPARSTDRRR